MLGMEKDKPYKYRTSCLKLESMLQNTLDSILCWDTLQISQPTLLDPGKKLCVGGVRLYSMHLKLNVLSSLRCICILCPCVLCLLCECKEEKVCVNGGRRLGERQWVYMLYLYLVSMCIVLVRMQGGEGVCQ